MFIVCIIALLGKMSMLFSFPTDKIRHCFAVQWGDQQYVWCLPEIDQRRINHTEAGRGLHKWSWIPSKCKCARGLHWNSCHITPDYRFNVHNIPLPIKKLPLSKAQNCCTAKTSDWRPGLKHQSKLIRFHYGETTVEMRRLWVFGWKRLFVFKKAHLQVNLRAKTQLYSLFIFALFREVQSTTCQLSFQRFLKIKWVRNDHL